MHFPPLRAETDAEPKCSAPCRCAFCGAARLMDLEQGQPELSFHHPRTTAVLPRAWPPLTRCGSRSSSNLKMREALPRTGRNAIGEAPSDAKLPNDVRSTIRHL